MIRCCERDCELVTEYKTGNMVLTLQAGLYAIIKPAIHQLYTHHPLEGREVQYKPIVDRNNYQTGCVYTIKQEGEKIYVVNMYHTKCRIMINGKQELSFFNDDIPPLLEIVHTLRDFYGKDLIDILNQPVKNTLFLINKDTTEDQKSIACVVCGRNVRSRAVQCHTCHRWVHYNCDNIAPEILNTISIPGNMYLYRCNTCQRSMSLPSHENSHLNPSSDSNSDESSKDENQLELVITEQPSTDAEDILDISGITAHSDIDKTPEAVKNQHDKNRNINNMNQSHKNTYISSDIDTDVITSAKKQETHENSHMSSHTHIPESQIKTHSDKTQTKVISCETSSIATSSREPSEIQSSSDNNKPKATSHDESKQVHSGKTQQKIISSEMDSATKPSSEHSGMKLSYDTSETHIEQKSYKTNTTAF